MSGPNQHHIPQFLQRACGVKPKGKRPKDIWVHRPNVEPELCPISRAASADYFYSVPSTDGSKTLDDRITDAEIPLSEACTRFRAQPFGSAVDALSAADIVMQLAPRSAHIRVSMVSAVNHLITTIGNVFTDAGQIERLLGLDCEEPTKSFLEKLRSVLRDHPEIERVGLPAPVFERVAFYLARERIDNTIADNAPLFVDSLSQFDEKAPSLARDAHNKFLDQMHEKDVRRDVLATFNWTIEKAPSEGAVLPDCVAVAYQKESTTLPLMYAGKEMDAVAIPLSSEKLLVGRRHSGVVVDLADFNREAAACCHDFYLARSNDANISALNSLIGTRTHAHFKDGTQAALDELLADRAESFAGAKEDADASIEPIERDLQFQYQIFCSGFSTQDLAYSVADAAKDVITGVARTLPMSRLDGITFAADYPASLREVNRGDASLPPVETASSEIGVGIARMVVVVRNGQAKGHVFFNAAIGEHLVGEDSTAREWALSLFVHQLTLVAMLEWIERALPGTVLQPISNEFQGFLYREVDAALHGYVASSISASLGDPKTISDTHRDLLISALINMNENVATARLAYRCHGDLQQLLAVAMPAVGSVLHFSAELLGGCSANNQPIIDEDGRLRQALQRVDLIPWLSDFARDLERFRNRLGVWKSLNEFIAFNRHVERLLWAVGLFPWESSEGVRVEIPLASDAAALLAQRAEDDA